MPTMKHTAILLVIVLVQACQKRVLVIEGRSSQYSGVITQSILIKSQSDNLLLVCFSEVFNHVITGISCQNDTGFHLFSGGLKDNQFQLEKVSSFILNIKPLAVLNYLKISLFDEYRINQPNSQRLNIDKSATKTIIFDGLTQRSIEVNIL